MKTELHNLDKSSTYKYIDRVINNLSHGWHRQMGNMLVRIQGNLCELSWVNG